MRMLSKVHIIIRSGQQSVTIVTVCVWLLSYLLNSEKLGRCVTLTVGMVKIMGIETQQFFDWQ